MERSAKIFSAPLSFIKSESRKDKHSLDLGERKEDFKETIGCYKPCVWSEHNEKKGSKLCINKTLKRVRPLLLGAVLCILERSMYQSGKPCGKTDGPEGDPGCWERCYQSNQLLVCSFHCDLDSWIPRAFIFVRMAGTIITYLCLGHHSRTLMLLFLKYSIS